MSAYDYEYELAKQDDVEFRWQTAPVEIIADASGQRVAALRCVRTEMQGGKLVNVAGSEFDLPVEMVIKAIGQQKQRGFLASVPNINVDAAGRVVVNAATMQTDNPKYFAGGDCVNGGAEAVDAAQHGKHAAMGIHQVLMGEAVTFAGA
jgi:glutamate synthase (NADPH/NADH) small chain